MNYRHHDIEAKLAGETDLASRGCCGTKRSDSRKQPPVTTPSLSLDVIEFPLICCKLAAFFHLLFFFTKTNYNSWHLEGHAEKWWWCISHSHYLFNLSFIYTHPRISAHEWVSYWQSPQTVSQFLKIRICLSGITDKYPLSSILNYSKLCLTQYQVYRFTKHTVSAKIWQKCKFWNIFKSG